MAIMEIGIDLARIEWMARTGLSSHRNPGTDIQQLMHRHWSIGDNSAMVVTEDVVMNSDTNSQADGTPLSSPRLRDWLWRPRRARLWWAAILIYWAGAALSLWVPPLRAFYDTALAGFLNVLFFPFTALLVLGVGFVRARLDSGDWELVEPTEEQMFPKLSIGGFRDPCSDPLDPRSGSLWIGSPQNQAQLFHRKWP